MSKGWICMHRDLKNWEWYKEPATCKLFIHLLLEANHSDGSHKGTIVKTGQIKTGRHLLSYETGLSEQQVRTSLKRLKSTNEITIKAFSKYSIISITNWAKYQSKGYEQPATQPTTNQQLTSNQPATNQQLTTNNNVNNENNVNKDLEATKINDDIAQAVQVWNQLAKAEGLAIVQKMSAIRKAKLKSRLKDCGGLEGWNIALDKIRGSPGLLGQVGEPWKADFDFLIQEQSFIKLMEGKYDGWTKKNRGSSGPKSFIEAAREIIEEGPEDPDSIPF